jgi:hypothetical protein
MVLKCGIRFLECDVYGSRTLKKVEAGSSGACLRRDQKEVGKSWTSECACRVVEEGSSVTERHRRSCNVEQWGKRLAAN